MSSQIQLNELIKSIETIYTSDPINAEDLIESYLKARLENLQPHERLGVIERLSLQFKGIDLQTTSRSNIDQETLSRLYSLILGKGGQNADISSEEVIEKLAQSLNTVFDKLNELVNIIHITLLGKAPELETIRHIIGSELGGTNQSESLVHYLDQIKVAFLAAHTSFKQAASTKVNEILSELDPDHISATADTGLKFGPLRKAEFFDIYHEKFNQIKTWFETGRFIEALLKEFEKNCQKVYLKTKEEL